MVATWLNRSFYFRNYKCQLSFNEGSNPNSTELLLGLVHSGLVSYGLEVTRHLRRWWFLCHAANPVNFHSNSLHQRGSALTSKSDWYSHRHWVEWPEGLVEMRTGLHAIRPKRETVHIFRGLRCANEGLIKLRVLVSESREVPTKTVALGPWQLPFHVEKWPREYKWVTSNDWVTSIWERNPLALTTLLQTGKKIDQLVLLP